VECSAYRSGFAYKFTKFRGDFTSFEPTERYDLVYWDAFSPEKQAEMWTEELFASMYEHMETGGHSGQLLRQRRNQKKVATSRLRCGKAARASGKNAKSSEL
jgi:hypothetical protein